MPEPPNMRVVGTMTVRFDIVDYINVKYIDFYNRALDVTLDNPKAVDKASTETNRLKSDL